MMYRQLTPSPTSTTSSDNFLDSNASFNDLASDSSGYTSYGCTPSVQSVAANYLTSPSPYLMIPDYLEEQLWYIQTNDEMVTAAPSVLTSDNMRGGPVADDTSSGTSYYIDHNGSGVSMKGDSTDQPAIMAAAKSKASSSKGLTRECQCPMCPRAFARKHDLQRHIRVHTGVKPYVCPCCQRSFARTDALRRHFRMEESCRSSPQVQEMKTRRKKGRNLLSRWDERYTIHNWGNLHTPFNYTALFHCPYFFFRYHFCSSALSYFTTNPLYVQIFLASPPHVHTQSPRNQIKKRYWGNTFCRGFGSSWKRLSFSMQSVGKISPLEIGKPLPHLICKC